MKAQISRDSFDEQRDYSAVYQQQGRMLTDADWNEMVRILKERMDRTVGAAIDSGSPRVDGILADPEAPYHTFEGCPRFRWGRVYVDGRYGELRGAVPPRSFEAGRAAEPVTDAWLDVSLEAGFSSPPVVVAAMQSSTGSDTAALRLRGRTARAVAVKVEEETSRDVETRHVGEVLGYVAVAAGELRDSSGQLIGEAGIREVAQQGRSTWHTIELIGEYAEPVVFVQLASFRGDQPAHTRVRNVQARKFQFQIEEWAYLDGTHGAEEVGYLVLERGRHRLADGTVIDVGKLTGRHSWTPVEFDPDMPVTPIVVSHCQTVNDGAAVVTRHREISEEGFEIRLQEQEAGEPGHGDETLGYLAACPNPELAIGDLIENQRDYPANAWGSLEDGRGYEVYVDLWERLVIALEDAHLTDVALHGADTCVRTQTMVQLKLAPQGLDVGALPTHGSAKVSVEVPAALSVVGAHDCNEESQGSESYRSRNTLLRLEVQSVSRKNGVIADVTLKWSTENGAEERAKDGALDDFLKDDYVYECFSTDTEKHLGEHHLQGVNGWKALESTLYSHAEYLAALADPATPASRMPRIRRWNGRVRLSRSGVGQWIAAGPPNAEVQGLAPGAQGLKLTLRAAGRRYEVTLSLESTEGDPEHFVVGDYWLVLLRDDGRDLTAEVASPLPVGVDHHYLRIGSLTVGDTGDVDYVSDEATWRRLSFPSLSRLTLDRILVEDGDGEEISIIDRFVDVEGDEMTGALDFLDSAGRVAMSLDVAAGTDSGAEPRISFAPQGSGAETAWIRATAAPDPTGTGRPSSTPTTPSGGPGGGRPSGTPTTTSGGGGGGRETTAPPSSGSTTTRTTLEVGVADGGHDDIRLEATGNILLDAANEVGIGTQAPRAKLDVRGSARIDNEEGTEPARERAPQSEHPLAGRGFLEVPWLYSGQLQGPSAAGSSEGDPRISLGPIGENGWDEAEWDGDWRTDRSYLGFGFGDSLCATLDEDKLRLQDRLEVGWIHGSKQAAQATIRLPATAQPKTEKDRWRAYEPDEENRSRSIEIMSSKTAGSVGVNTIHRDKSGVLVTPGQLEMWSHEFQELFGLTVMKKRRSLRVTSNGIFAVKGSTASRVLTETGSPSDEGLKREIQPLANALERVRQLRGVSFEWRDESEPKGRRVGFIAQEVAKVLPELVTEEEGEPASVAYHLMVPVLLEAIKEQDQKVEAIERRVAELESTLEERAVLRDLEARLTRVETQLKKP